MVFNPAVDALRRKEAAFIPLAGAPVHQYFQGLIDGFNGIDMKAALGGGLYDIMAQHQVFDIGVRDQDTLITG